jgi:hypothetical protein
VTSGEPASEQAPEARRPLSPAALRLILLQRTMPPACSQSAPKYPLTCRAVDQDAHFVTLTQKALQAFLPAGPSDAILAIDHLRRRVQATGRQPPGSAGGRTWSISAMTPAGVPR